MKLPFADNAIVDDTKLAGYCLSVNHPKGKYKATLFASLLGFSAGDAFRLREILIDNIKSHDAIPTKRNEFGQYYEVRFELPGNKGQTQGLSVLADSAMDPHPNPPPEYQGRG